MPINELPALPLEYSKPVVKFDCPSIINKGWFEYPFRVDASIVKESDMTGNIELN